MVFQGIKIHRSLHPPSRAPVRPVIDRFILEKSRGFRSIRTRRLMAETGREHMLVAPKKSLGCMGL